ncbi:MAG: hypothetical protein RR320_06660 [Oscillospiraceae bacterium]
MTYTMCAKLIALGRMSAEKLDVFYAAGRLTGEQYTELIGLLQG